MGVVVSVAVGVVVMLAATSEPTASVAPTPTAAPSPSVVVVQPEPVVQTIEAVVVPALARLSLGEATAALGRAGLALGEVSPRDSPYPAETVLESDPSEGSQVDAGRAVALSVASGANVVPDVTGLDPSTSATAVMAAGFVPSFTPRSAPPGAAWDGILGTVPAAGERAAVGGIVTILVAQPAEPEPTPTAAPSPTMTPRPTPAPTLVR